MKSQRSAAEVVQQKEPYAMTECYLKTFSGTVLEKLVQIY